MLTRQSLLSAAALMMLATTAPARDLVTSGYWKSYITDDARLCGMYTKLDNNRDVYVKFQRGGSTLFMQLMKPSWRFPNSGIQVKATVSLDNTRLNAFGAGYVDKVNNISLNVVTFNVDANYTNGFLQEFAEANWLLIDFAEGNEPRWAASLIGSRETARSFANCIIAMGGLQQRPPEASTQPFDPKRAEPLPLPEIPYNQQTQPTQPKPPAVPVQKKKDDNSI